MTEIFKITPESNPETWEKLQPAVVSNITGDDKKSILSSVDIGSLFGVEIPLGTEWTNEDVERIQQSSAKAAYIYDAFQQVENFDDLLNLVDYLRGLE